MTNNKPASTVEKLVLPKEVRLMMVKALESINDLDADSYDDEKILKKYNEYVIGIEKKVSGYETSYETKSINAYLGKAKQYGDIRVENKEFLMRLYKMNIPYFYLHLFRDEHADIKEGKSGDRELWKIINKSGINPFKEISQLTKMKRSPIKPK